MSTCTCLIFFKDPVLRGNDRTYFHLNLKGCLNIASTIWILFFTTQMFSVTSHTGHESTSVNLFTWHPVSVSCVMQMCTVLPKHTLCLSGDVSGFNQQHENRHNNAWYCRLSKGQWGVKYLTYHIHYAWYPVYYIQRLDWTIAD